LPAWVTRVSLNLAKSRLRRIRAEATAKQRLGAAAEEHAAPGGMRTDVERALGTLPRREREVTVLRYYLGMDVAEIARTLGVSDGTVKTQLFRARQALARELGEEADEEEVDRASPR
jgi:RNA polymerase sigma-70 factor, ECF subfamily